MHTVVPYCNPLYYDFRQTVNVPQDRVLPIDDKFGFHPHTWGLSSRCGTRATWRLLRAWGIRTRTDHTFARWTSGTHASRDKVATEGWLGRAVRDLDPNKENVLTAVNFGNGLPRAMVMPGVPVTSVSQA